MTPPATTAVAHSDLIKLSSVTAIGYHGVFEHEKRDGQPFITDAVLHMDVSAAAQTDDLSKTADYGAVAETIVALVTGEAFDLIETLSVRMAEKILADFPVVNAVEITVHKPKAPIQVPFGDVSITVFRSRTGTELA
ncbi:dihydroneopterin aldolase [Arthrobacter alpinus]|uniref:7,8-dihydroneopterin aldolase n=1 Tax=Arthrobacter alpinus TaxID=656366 RepID=A0A1H5N359_9MICC|nr:dihydroneopterin aldolase [Arthrobacter alpinus]SEE96022.1 dihydroneopterin aldolase [Arthrobacter alpinus]